MGFGDTSGYPPLKEAIADYVRSSWAVQCEANQIIITAGAQQALDLCARIFLNQGDYAAIENPGYIGARRALLSTGAHLLPCPVDHQGLQVEHLKSLPHNPRLIYLTPAHQYPMGPVLSLDRRMALLEWAQQHQCWILEDDYDSEYHYSHRPLASLQGLDQHQQVLYIGSFSKVLFPSLRLGYLILPPHLVNVFTQAKAEHSGQTPLHVQAVTAAFMQEGHFSRHLKRTRISYGEKLSLLLDCCRELEEWCVVHASGAGMHLVLEFKTDISEEEVHNRLLGKQILSTRLSSYFIGQDKKYGLALGFANSTHQDIQNGITTLRKIFTSL